MISVIIPTHDPKYLNEAVESVFRQTLKDFEIVLVPNGDVPEFPELLRMLPQVRIVPLGGDPGQRAIGRVKKFAFSEGKGEILLELDHDDVLSENCLEEVQKAFADPAVDFVYSNFAEMVDGAPRPGIYDKSFGWKTRPVTLDGKKFMETVAFPPSPASFAKIFTAPNHVRAWRRSFYEKIGGHNEAFRVCDDHELLIRTYLRGTVSHIDKCLYLYRLHAGNTIQSSQEEIIRQTWVLYSQNIEALILHWAKQRGLPCVTLGEGPRGEWMTPKELGFSFGSSPENRLGAVKAHDYLHLQGGKVATLNEIYRALVPGGWLLSATPGALGAGAHLDPRAVSYWSKSSFYFATEKRFANQVPGSIARFQAQRLDEAYPSTWHKEERMHYVNFDAIALKDGYDGPGPHTI